MDNKPFNFSCTLLGRRARLTRLPNGGMSNIYIFRFARPKRAGEPFLIALQIKVDAFGALTWGFADRAGNHLQIRDPVIFFAAADCLDIIFYDLN